MREDENNKLYGVRKKGEMVKYDLDNPALSLSAYRQPTPTGAGSAPPSTPALTLVPPTTAKSRIAEEYDELHPILIRGYRYQT